MYLRLKDSLYCAMVSIIQAIDFIHNFVPGRSDGTLLLLHGTSGNEEDLIGLGHSLDPNANLLSPRGRVLENGMPRFFRRLAEGVLLADLLRKAGAEVTISFAPPATT